MARSAKTRRRAARTAAAARLRAAIAARTPAMIRRRISPILRYGEMLFVDHLVFRLAFPNRHKVADGVWRAAQPLPHQIEWARRHGIRTIVNLRGETHPATYAFEQATCRRAGIKLVDYRVKSRAAPTREELRGARDLFAAVEYPIMMHCKSGADRVGLMSTLYLHLRDGVPIAQAVDQLSLRYGHVAQADTGIIDFFFARYLADTATNPMPFFDWVETVYDPKELKHAFRANGWANRLVDSVLRRE